MFEYKTRSGKRFKTFKQLEKAVGPKRAHAALRQIRGWVSIEEGEVSLAGFSFFYSETMILYHAECSLTGDEDLQREFGRRIVQHFPYSIWTAEQAKQELDSMIRILQRDEILVIADPGRGPQTTIVSPPVKHSGIH